MNSESAATIHPFRHVDPALLQSAELVSCDLFDTLIFRCCSSPSDIFHETAVRMIRSGALPEDRDPLEFVSMRIYAERIARAKKPAYECSFEEIALEMAHVCDPVELMRHEMQTELDCCILNEELTERLIALHKAGKKLCIISDIYHPVRTLALLLKSVNFPIKILSRIFSSSDERANKATGDLFKRVLRHFGVPASRWAHIGDNPVSDAHNVQNIGGTAFFIPQRAYLEEVLLREKILNGVDRECASLETMRELSARRAVEVEAGLRPYFMAGASAFGPALARFGDWCVEQCERNGIKKALVCTREAETFLPLLEAAARSSGSALDIRPFYVSREAVGRAFLFPLHINKLGRILTVKRKPHSIRQLLAWLRLDPERCAGLLKLGDIDTPLFPRNPVLQDLARAIMASEECFAALDEVAAGARDEFLAYFNGLCGQGERGAVVDLGFSGTTQEFIEEILRGASSDIRISGMYFCLNRPAARHLLRGGHVSSYLGRLGMQARETSVMTRHPEILEQSLIGSAGTVLGYENGRPVLEKVVPRYAQVRQTEAVRNGIFTFADMWRRFRARLAASGSDLSPQAYADIDSRNAVILQRLFSYPLKTEAEAFGRLRHDDNFGSKTGGLICSESDLALLEDHGYESLLVRNQYYWPQGVFHIRNDDRPDAAFSYFEQMYM